MEPAYTATLQKIDFFQNKEADFKLIQADIAVKAKTKEIALEILVEYQSHSACDPNIIAQWEEKNLAST